jgi:ribosomal protein S18 acetylase RimI-like enzyme
MAVRVVVVDGVADGAMVEEVAAVAAQTVPLACPPGMPAEDIARFVEANLSPARFAEYVVDPARRVFVALDDDDRVVGYAMTVDGVLDDDDVQRAVAQRPAVELSKMYALPEAHGSGISAALMERVVAHAADSGARSVWLGVNQQNARAQRFYSKHGFAVSGTKTFRVGSRVEEDFVMVRPLPG